MKNKASVFLKHIISAIASIAKAKSAAIKNKTSAAKSRLVLFSLVNNRKVLFSSISNKIHNLLSHSNRDSDDDDDDIVVQRKAMVLYNAKANESQPSSSFMKYHEDDDADADADDDNKYPDLRHSLFNELEEEEDDFDDPGGSVIDLVKNSKEGDDQQKFSLEDEIDHVADLFIKRFHKRIRLQKLESFKRLQEMLQRGV